MGSHEREYPFSRVNQLCLNLDANCTEDAIQYIPGHPSVRLSDSDAVFRVIRKELWADDLERVASRLWTLSTPSSGNISPLHRQKVLGRQIVVTEDPRLHLLWIDDRIFIKPLPAYLTSFHFWVKLASAGTYPLSNEDLKLYRAAIGFLRTYRHLIQHESDFLIAQNDHLRLIPGNAGWTAVSAFLTDLEQIQDEGTSPRYHYGELRLSRLNLYAPLLFHQSHYEYIPMQYSQYFTRLYGPVLFVFAVIATILNAMQVAITADKGDCSSGRILCRIFYWFGITVLVISVLIGLTFAALWMTIVGGEWKFSLQNRPKSP